MIIKRSDCLVDHPDDIVISGIGGRYPNSDNVDQFWTNLMSGLEMTTIDDSRWPLGKSFNHKWSSQREI